MAVELPRIVARNVGLLLRYMSWLPVLLVPVAVAFAEWSVLPVIVLTAAIFFLVGEGLSRLPAPREPRLREGLLIAAVGWLLVPLASTPLFLMVEDWRLLDAYFETMSAWTGTGVTVADVTLLTHTTLAWRSLMQWVGGLGVIVLTLAILARPGTGAHTLYVSEAREDKLRPSVLSTVRTLWRIYALLTAASVALLLLAGLPLWHALNHGLTGIATGGMSINPGGIADYASPSVAAALMVIMVVGGLPFVVHYAVIRGRWPVFVTDPQVRAMFILLAAGFILILWDLVQRLPGDLSAHLVNAAFQVVSAVSTTGFNTTDVATWPARTKFAIVGLMLLGGAAGSTAGGLKLVRGALLVKGALWKLERSGRPPFALTSFRFGNRKLNLHEANEEFAEAAFIGMLWAVTFLVGILLVFAFLPSDVDVENVIFDIASVQGNNGVTTGVIGAGSPDGVKAAAVAIMWAARLEVLPVLLLVRGFLRPTLKPGRR